MEGGRWGWVGQGGVVGGNWRQLYLNNNKKKRNSIEIESFKILYIVLYEYYHLVIKI